MATRDQILQAIRNADAAGDSTSVRRLGQFLLQSDQQAQQAAERESVNPTADMSGLDRFRAGWGKAVADTGRGLGQLARKVMPDAAADAIGLPTQADIDEAKHLDAPLARTGAGIAGNIGGAIATALPTVFIPGAATLPGAAAVGAGMGFLQPVASDDSRLANTAIGGVAGAGGVALGRAVAAGVKGAKALIEPLTEGGRNAIAGRTLQRFGVTAGDLGGVSSQPTATGAQATLAEQIARPEGAAGAARLQDAVRALDPEIAGKFAAREVENNAARVNALRDLAGSGGARDAAAAARQAAAEQLYQEAFANTRALTPSQLKAQQQLLASGKIDKLMQSPAIQDAMTAARANAENSGKVFSSDGSIEGLHQMKIAIDDMIKDPATAAQAAKVASLKHAQQRLIDIIETLSPAYRDARLTYAAMSRPVNQADVAAEVLKRGTSATSDLAGNPRLMPDALLRSVSDEGRLMKQATGRNVGETLANLLDPPQLTTLRNVIGETDKAAAVARAGNGPGSATAQRLASQNVLRQVLGPTGLPQSWAESTMLNTMMRPVQFVYNGVAEPKIQQTLADLLLNPAKAQAAMQAARTAPQMLSPGLRAALPYLEQAGRASLPATSLATMAGQR